MKVRMLVDQESPKYGPLKKDGVYDLDPEDERNYIERGIAELSSTPKKKDKGKKGEVIDNVQA